MKKQQQNKTRKTVNLNKVGMKEKGKKKTVDRNRNNNVKIKSKHINNYIEHYL